MYVDSHAHIEMANFDHDRAQVIRRAQDAGVDIIVNVGTADTGLESVRRALALTEEYDHIYAVVGVHPHDSWQASADLYAELERLSAHPHVIAWGEIGLDYYYNNSPRHIQREAFRKQLQLARRMRLPVVVHTRDAEDDTWAILQEEWKGSGLSGIIHCFTGSLSFAQRCLELGFFISFSGIITFNRTESLRQVAKALPLDRLLIETDSPFLAPAPHRGKRNEPAFVVEVARALADLKQLTVDEVARQTTQNFKRLFNIH